MIDIDIDDRANVYRVAQKSKLLILESMKLMIAKHELVSQNLSQN